ALILGINRPCSFMTDVGFPPLGRALFPFHLLVMLPLLQHEGDHTFLICFEVAGDDRTQEAEDVDRVLRKLFVLVRGQNDGARTIRVTDVIDGYSRVPAEVDTRSGSDLDKLHPRVVLDVAGLGDISGDPDAERGVLPQRDRAAYVTL